MRYSASSPEEYLATIPEDRRPIMTELRDVINANIPDGFSEHMAYGHFGWVVPHEIYPPGYHCDPTKPLMFIGLASQKNFIALYHMAMYCDPRLLAWFQDEWSKASPRKLDMGKSCIRFKKPEHIPVDLIGRLAARVSCDEWIQMYERALKR